MHSLSMRGMAAGHLRPHRSLPLLLLLIALFFLGMPDALAHGVAEGDKGFIQESTGVMLMPFVYMGAKPVSYTHLTLPTNREV